MVVSPSALSTVPTRLLDRARSCQSCRCSAVSPRNRDGLRGARGSRAVAVLDHAVGHGIRRLRDMDESADQALPKNLGVGESLHELETAATRGDVVHDAARPQYPKNLRPQRPNPPDPLPRPAGRCVDHNEVRGGRLHVRELGPAVRALTVSVLPLLGHVVVHTPVGEDDLIRCLGGFTDVREATESEAGRREHARREAPGQARGTLHRGGQGEVVWRPAADTVGIDRARREVTVVCGLKLGCAEHVMRDAPDVFQERRTSVGVVKVDSGQRAIDDQ